MIQHEVTHITTNRETCRKTYFHVATCGKMLHLVWSSPCLVIVGWANGTDGGARLLNKVFFSTGVIAEFPEPPEKRLRRALLG